MADMSSSWCSTTGSSGPGGFSRESGCGDLRGVGFGLVFSLRGFNFGLVSSLRRRCAVLRSYAFLFWALCEAVSESFLVTGGLVGIFSDSVSSSELVGVFSLDSAGGRRAH